MPSPGREAKSSVRKRGPSWGKVNHIEPYRPALEPSDFLLSVAENSCTATLPAEMNLSLSEMEKKFHYLEKKCCVKQSEKKDYHRDEQRRHQEEMLRHQEEQIRHQILPNSMRVEMDHLAKAMSSIQQSLEALKGDTSHEQSRAEFARGHRDRKARKVWISDMPPTVNCTPLNMRSPSYNNPEDLSCSRQKVVRSTRLSALPPQVDQTDQPGEPDGRRRPQLNSA